MDTLWLLVERGVYNQSAQLLHFPLELFPNRRNGGGRSSLWRLTFIWIVMIPHNAHCVPMIEAKRLMMFREIIDVNYENHMNNINTHTLSQRNAEYISINASVVYSYHCDFKATYHGISWLLNVMQKWRIFLAPLYMQYEYERETGTTNAELTDRTKIRREISIFR
jgi:hypothetical protein